MLAFIYEGATEMYNRMGIGNEGAKSRRKRRRRVGDRGKKKSWAELLKRQRQRATQKY